MLAPSEDFIRQHMDIFRNWKPHNRERVLTALLAVKVSRSVDGLSAVLDPKLAELLQPIISNEVGMEATIEALRRLDAENEKKKGGFFSFLKR